MILTSAKALVNSVVQLHAKRPLRQTDIQSATGLSLRAVQQALNSLEKGGALRRETLAGSTVYVGLTEGPEGRALWNLALAAIGLPALISTQMDHIRTIALIGSLARGQERASSDLDLLIVGKPDQRSLRSAFRELERRYGRQVDAVILTTEELHSRQEAGDVYVRTAISEAIVLNGRQI